MIYIYPIYFKATRPASSYTSGFQVTVVYKSKDSQQPRTTTKCTAYPKHKSMAMSRPLDISLSTTQLSSRYDGYLYTQKEVSLSRPSGTYIDIVFFDLVCGSKTVKSFSGGGEFFFYWIKHL